MRILSSINNCTGYINLVGLYMGEERGKEACEAL